MSAADVDPLFAVEARVHEAAGATCTVPVLYRETTFFGALYTIDPAVARRGFEGLCIEPWPMLDGVPVVVAALEHQGSTLGPYRAFVVAVLARRIGFEATLLRFVLDMRALEEQALWITALGSTSDAAQKAGPAIWGLSHEPADVGITLGPIAEAQVPGELVLRCERPPRAGAPLPAADRIRRP